MDFIKFDLSSEIDLELTASKLKFSKTHFNITLYRISGNLENQDQFDNIEYILIRNKDYNAKASANIINLEHVMLNDKLHKFTWPTFTNTLFVGSHFLFDNKNFYKTNLEALNALLLRNKKKFPHSNPILYSKFPPTDPISLDKDLSQVTIDSFVSRDGQVGILRLEGTYPYKGYLEANYINNQLDLIIEFESIKTLIIDVRNFNLERTWDNDLPDLIPTHQRYLRREFEVYYLINEEQEFMREVHEDRLYIDISHLNLRMDLKMSVWETLKN